jgi:hypothetical protein
VTEKRKLRTTFLLGLVPLIVGLSIFFSWWIGKAWLLTTFRKLELYGFCWIIISAFMAILGLGIGIAYLFDAKGKDIFKGAAAIICILINIPAVNWVSDKQHDVAQRAYVRLYNQTGLEIDSLTISNSLYTEHLERIPDTDHKTGYFYPNYDEWDSGLTEIEPVKLTLVFGQKKKTIVMPVVYKDGCEAFVIDSTFNVTEFSIDQ